MDIELVPVPLRETLTAVYKRFNRGRRRARHAPHADHGGQLLPAILIEAHRAVFDRSRRNRAI
jgi:hypothetical protein